MSSTEVIQINHPGTPPAVQELAPVVAAAHAFVIVDKASHETALLRIKLLRSGEKEITEHHEPTRAALELAKKKLLAARDGLIGPLVAARQVYNRKADEYEAADKRRTEEERIAKEREARQAEEARKLTEALAAEEAGDDELAHQIIEEEITVPAVQVQSGVAKVAGVSTRELWSAEVFNPMALIRFVAQHPEWVRLLEPSLPELNAIARAQREAMTIPGVRAVSKKNRATRDA